MPMNMWLAALKRARDVGLNLIQAKVLVSFQNQVPLFFGKVCSNHQDNFAERIAYCSGLGRRGQYQRSEA